MNYPGQARNPPPHFARSQRDDQVATNHHPVTSRPIRPPHFQPPPPRLHLTARDCSTPSRRPVEMASPAEAVAQVNGLAAPVPSAAPAPAPAPGPAPSPSPPAELDPQLDGSTTAKRKREPNDDGPANLDDLHDAKPVISDDQPPRDETTLIRDYFAYIQRYAMPFHQCRLCTINLD